MGPCRREDVACGLIEEGPAAQVHRVRPAAGCPQAPDVSPSCAWRMKVTQSGGRPEHYSCRKWPRSLRATGAERGDDGPPRRALEQLLTEAFLKGGDAMADHRLRHPGSGRSGGETAALTER